MNRSYQINEYFFDAIDSEIKAYILGLLFSDGGVNQAKSCVHFGSIDRELVETVYKPIFIKGDPLKSRILSSGSKFWEIRISRVHLVNTLVGLGCTPKKSLTLSFPNIPAYLFKYFIRGYFDGDGCIIFRRRQNHYIGRWELMSTLDFCNKVHQILSFNGIFSYVFSPPSFKQSIVVVEEVASLQRLFNYLYDKESPRLSRKYKTFAKAITTLNSYSRYIGGKSNSNWSDSEINTLVKNYKYCNNYDLSTLLEGRSPKAIKQQAKRLGLKKS